MNCAFEVRLSISPQHWNEPYLIDTYNDYNFDQRGLPFQLPFEQQQNEHKLHL